MKQLFVLLILVVCCSCDSGSYDLGSGFEFSWIHVQENTNVFYRNVGLIDDNTYGAVRYVKWSRRYIFVETQKDSCFIIDRHFVLNRPGMQSPESAWPISKERAQQFHFEDSINSSDL